MPARPAPDLLTLDAAVHTSRSAAEASERRARTLEAELTRARAQATRVAEQLARADASRDTLHAELLRAEGNLEQAHDSLAAATERFGSARSAREQAEQAFAALGGTRDAALHHERHLSSELARVNASVAPLRRERERLEAALNSYARYGEGARNALRLEHPGIVGSVADLLSVPAEYETALGAALGRRLEQIVVSRADDAREIIEELRRAGGRATFLPLDLIRARPRRDAGLLREDGVIGNLADLCPTDPRWWARPFWPTPWWCGICAQPTASRAGIRAAHAWSRWTGNWSSPVEPSLVDACATQVPASWPTSAGFRNWTTNWRTPTPQRTGSARS
ncbi:hypothetical protein ACFSC4_01780 [Deinococcus malanensis]|uniref:hypothetical protein n=1 Tax=Deinococcus malanensis TaxID=1706855 RepID=UPI0036432A9D